MTALGIVLIAVVLILGATSGVSAYYLMGRLDYQRGVLDGQRQAEMAHTGWHPALADGLHVPESLPSRRDLRRWSQVDRQEPIQRPVIHY